MVIVRRQIFLKLDDGAGSPVPSFLIECNTSTSSIDLDCLGVLVTKRIQLLSMKTGLHRTFLCAFFGVTVLFAHAEEPNYQHGISLLHPLKYGPDFEHFEYADPNATKGGLVVLSTTAPIVNFSGQRRAELPNAVGLGRTTDRLFIRTADELSGLYGQLASGVALSSDKRSLYVRLHEHAKWHDGQPLTTADVKFSHDLTMDSVVGKVYFEPWLHKFEVLGPHEFVVHHRETFTNSNLIAMTWFPVRPAHYWEGKDPTKATLIPPVGSGPYKIKKFDRSFVLYERVEDYWGRDIPVNRGRYNYDYIRYEVYRDQSVAREAFRKGLFDIAFESDIRHWFASDEVPAVVDGWILKETRDVQKFIGAQGAIALNSNRKQLSDVRVREALSWAFDFEWQNRVMRGDTQHRALSYFAKSRFASSGLPSPEELRLLKPHRDQLDQRVLNDEFAFPVSTGYGTNRDALLKAQELLAEAGWGVVNGRLMNAAGEPFTLEILTQNPTMQRVLLPYTESLKLLGIDAKMRLVDNVTAINLVRARKFDAYIRDHTMLNPPIGELRNFFASASAAMVFSGNLPAIQDPVIDALIQAAEEASSIEEIAVACRALDRVLLWGFYNILLNTMDDERFLYWDKFTRPAGEAVAKYEHITGSAIRILDSWWIDQDKLDRLPTVQN